MTGSGPRHLPEIDRVKGVAILFVIAIHAKIGDPSVIHDQLVNRAVPIFLFVFGLMSELSLRRAKAEGRSIKDWYLARLTRLYLPIWGMTALYWLAVLHTGKPPLPIGAGHAVLTALGYAPWIGPSWFVTLVIQLVLIFPALSWVADRLGPWLLLPLSAAITVYTVYNSLYIADFGIKWVSSNVPPAGWFYIWIFLPRSLWSIVAGLFVGRLLGTKLSVRATIAAVVISLFVESAIHLIRPEEFIAGTMRRLVVMHLWDVPIAVAVLGVMGNVPLPAVLARPLEWCGRWSWGIYLGHIVVFVTMHMYGKFPEGGGVMGRLLYGAFLLLCGVTLALIGDAVRRRIFTKLGSSSPGLRALLVRAGVER